MIASFLRNYNNADGWSAKLYGYRVYVWPRVDMTDEECRFKSCYPPMRSLNEVQLNFFAYLML